MLELLITLFVVMILVWLIDRISMPPPSKNIIYICLSVIVFVWLLSRLGLAHF